MSDMGERKEHLAPPDGGYGWICVVACFLINCFTWGIVSSYGVYLSYHLKNDTFPGAQPLDFAFIGGSKFAAAMLSAPLVTVLARKYGARRMMYVGACMLATGEISASFAAKAWHLYLSQGALVGTGIGFVYIPSTAILSQWFLKRRSLANGICTAGTGVGGIIFSLSTNAIIEGLSYRWALRITGITALVMTLVATALIKDRNNVVQPKQNPFDLDLLHRYDVWLLLLWSFVSMLGYITLLYSLPDFARSIGLSDTRATHVIMLLNLGTAIGRPLIGIISDKCGRIRVAGILTLMCGVLCFMMWIPAHSFAVTSLFAIISGAIIGVFWVTIAPLCAEVVGLEELPSLLSLTWLFTVLPTFFSEAISLKLRREESQGQYLHAQIYAGLSYVVASLFIFELHRQRTATKRGETQL